MSDVLIVGAGPTGLTIAYELIRRGISVRLIEAREGPEAYSRAVGIQSRTLELFEKMGVLPAFLKEGKKATAISLHWKDKQVHFSLKELDAPHPFVLLLPQSETEKLLRRHLEEAGGSVEWKTRLLDLGTIELPSGEREKVTSPWIVGCDGGHSTVRHDLNLSFRGTKFEEAFLLADVKAYTSHPLEGPNVFLSKKGFGLLIPFPKEHSFRVVLPGATATETPHQLTTVIKERGFSEPFEVTEIDMISSFQIQRRHAGSFRQGHIFLAGDAAHIHSPFGGQGMNTSIQDAFNLAWKLALVIEGASPDSLLDTYEIERLPIAKLVLKETTRMTQLLTFSQKRFPPLFYWGMRLLLSSKKRQQKVAQMVSEIGLFYPQDSIVYELPQDKDWKGPKAGHRAPDAPLANGTRLFDLLKSPRFVLLLFAENPTFVNAMKSEYGKWIDVHIIKGEAVKQKYAAETTSLYLIRPDGYIGFRSHHFKTEELIAYLLKLFKAASKRNKS